MQKRKDFQFVPSTAEAGKRMVFQGGITKNSNLLRTQMISRMVSDIEEERQVIRNELEGEARKDYGKDILTKRLFEGVISDIYDIS